MKKNIDFSAPELLRIQQELEIHQIELEEQNHELRAAQIEIEAGLKRYTDLFDFAPVGYRVILASDGAEAVALYAARGAEIAAILTDMMMPGMDGFALIRILRGMDPGVRIIAASGYASGGVETKLAGLGVTHFLPKPYTRDSLLVTLGRILDKRSSPAKRL